MNIEFWKGIADKIISDFEKQLPETCDKCAMACGENYKKELVKKLNDNKGEKQIR